jgi:hypothetical protein
LKDNEDTHRGRKKKSFWNVSWSSF